MITLSKTLLSDINKHGEKTFPEECCGALLGKYERENDNRIVKEILPIDNFSDDDKKRRFVITPIDYIKIEKIAKEKKLTLLGFYHSHPGHPAKPSQTDLDYAWPNLSYPIVSILQGKADIMNSFVLDTEKKKFIEEKIIIA